MISKSFTAFCECCTCSTPLYSMNFKQSEEEIKHAGWKKLKTIWYCEECILEHGEDYLKEKQYLKKL